MSNRLRSIFSNSIINFADTSLSFGQKKEMNERDKWKYEIMNKIS